MNKQTAIQKGLQFTGFYKRDKTEANKERDDLCKLGYKAYTVTIPDSPRSWGYGGVGYSVYAEPKYFKDEEARRFRVLINLYPSAMEAMLEKHRKEINKFNAEHNDRLKWMKDNGYTV